MILLKMRAGKTLETLLHAACLQLLKSAHLRPVLRVRLREESERVSHGICITFLSRVSTLHMVAYAIYKLPLFSVKNASIVSKMKNVSHVCKAFFLL